MAFPDHFRMLFHHQPADVGEEEAAVAVVRIRVRVCVFMMHPMISHPIENFVLQREKVEERLFFSYLSNSYLISYWEESFILEFTERIVSLSIYLSTQSTGLIVVV